MLENQLEKLKTTTTSAYIDALQSFVNGA